MVATLVGQGLHYRPLKKIQSLKVPKLPLNSKSGNWFSHENDILSYAHADIRYFIAPDEHLLSALVHLGFNMPQSIQGRFGITSYIRQRK